MTVEDALRKIALLRRVSTDKGALAAERETAYRLQKVLMERYAIKDQEFSEGPTTSRPFRLNWDYWQELLDEFGLSLTRFGGRGSASLRGLGRRSLGGRSLGRRAGRLRIVFQRQT